MKKEIEDMQPEWVKNLDTETAVKSERLSDFQRKEEAVNLIISYGDIDGDHHKMWCLDQVLQILLGTDYTKTIIDACDGDDGPFTYDWDQGIAP